MNRVDYDHLAIAEMESPFEALAELRARCPVAHTDAHGGYWAAFTYEDVGAIARDPQRFSSAQGVSIPAHAFPMALPPIEVDPPRHLQIRGPLLDKFSPAAVSQMEPALRRVVGELIDDFVAEGFADLATQLTMPLPGIAIAHLLSLPDEVVATVREWTIRLIQNPTDLEAIGDAMELIAALYDDRSEAPRDDIPSLVAQLVIDGEPISEGEYLCMMTTLVMAGLDTTANAGANVLELLSKHPELRARLVDDPTRIPGAIEELLRFSTPLPSLARTATAQVEIRGETIEPGEKVSLCWIAANHDPEEFPDPERIDFDRFPNRHFVFGTGPHRCLGAHLARLELRVLLEEVLQRLPDFEVVHEDVRRYSGITRGISSLPARFAPGTRLRDSVERRERAL